MKNLRAIRKAKGLTVRQCAEAVQVTHQQFTRYEGLRADPPPAKREAIADFLGVSLDELHGRRLAANLPRVAGGAV